MKYDNEQDEGEWCRVDEWSPKCIYNDTGHVEFCAEGCVLSRRHRQLEEPVLVILVGNETSLE